MRHPLSAIEALSRLASAVLTGHNAGGSLILELTNCQRKTYIVPYIEV